MTLPNYRQSSENNREAAAELASPKLGDETWGYMNQHYLNHIVIMGAIIDSHDDEFKLATKIQISNNAGLHVGIIIWQRQAGVPCRLIDLRGLLDLSHTEKRPISPPSIVSSGYWIRIGSAALFRHIPMRLPPAVSCLTVGGLSELDSNPLVMAQKDATSNVFIATQLLNPIGLST
jgi:hypothetical protein